MTGRIMKSSKWNFLMIFLYQLKTFFLETKKSWSSVKKRESSVKCSTILSSPTHVVALPFIYLFFRFIFTRCQVIHFVVIKNL